MDLINQRKNVKGLRNRDIWGTRPRLFNSMLMGSETEHPKKNYQKTREFYRKSGQCQRQEEVKKDEN